jgi:hypothetical protein
MGWATFYATLFYKLIWSPCCHQTALQNSDSRHVGFKAPGLRDQWPRWRRMKKMFRQQNELAYVGLCKF